MYTIFEIYVKNAITGESGWTIENVMADSRNHVEQYPHFDCIISESKVNNLDGFGIVRNVKGDIVSKD